MWMNALIWLSSYSTVLFELAATPLSELLGKWYMGVPSVAFLSGIDYVLREVVLCDRMHMECSLKKQLPWTHWLFFPLIFVFNPLADIVCTMLAAYTAQFKLAINPVQEYQTSPKMFTGGTGGALRPRGDSIDLPPMDQREEGPLLPAAGELV
jgi:hypothetical protein